MSGLLNFRGAENFRLRLILSTLSGKAIKIDKIRSNDLNPGLRDHEVSFLRLLEAVTNGSSIEISYTGTTLVYRPGLIIGGSLSHACPSTRSVTYFIEPMLYLAPFSKQKFSIIFKGLTSHKSDLGIDSIRWGILPVMEKFGVRECSLHTLSRGEFPNGGGEVHLMVDSRIPQPVTMHALDLPKITSIRGISYCTRVSPSIVNRMIDSAKSVLRPTGVEINITSDVWRGDKSGKSPGFGITLFTETKSGWRLCIDDIGAAGETPEDLAQKVAFGLLELIESSGVVSSFQLQLAMVFMVIGKEDIGRLIIYKDQIDEKLISLMRDIKAVFGTEFYFRDSDEKDFLIATAKGIGFTNASKKIA
ncbi:unnamed protein product [Kuraishia capsulata CBS 1993]|uniref:RNA 3'-terminal phosphate cyclase domain-containing protein n=1 Tax=Kuraishia capsulata CBS 1993 TaxID=1382522 RepID=W6MNG2_9ASCO|nr:uncharacterized protein KUCA_T00002544001 [Kuraishia capsulata CBS 1993]CDK26572.1 unnamed protein product [Kuraishia capsulata CBS 1993]